MADNKSNANPPIPPSGVELPESGDRRARRQTATRERLFRAAMKLFAERGFFETTVEDITEAADVGKGTFFNYFPTKEHVLEAFGEIQRSKIEATLVQARTTQTPFPILFRRMGDALLEEPGRSPAFLRSVMIANLSSESVRGRLCENLALGRHKLAELLSLAQERGEVRSDMEPAAMARSVQQSFFGAMLFWCMHGGTDLRSWYEPAFRLILSGLEARPAQPVALASALASPGSSSSSDRSSTPSSADSAAIPSSPNTPFTKEQ